MMKDLQTWLKKHAFEMHSLAFAAMALASAGMYLSARSANSGLTLIGLGIFVAANILVVLVR
jgi:hypothetical protein